MSKEKDLSLEELLKPSGVKCSLCAKDIPYGRILAIPNTKLCIQCVGDLPEPDPNVICDRSSDSARNGWAKND